MRDWGSFSQDARTNTSLCSNHLWNGLQLWFSTFLQFAQILAVTPRFLGNSRPGLPPFWWTAMTTAECQMMLPLMKVCESSFSAAQPKLIESYSAHSKENRVIIGKRRTTGTFSSPLWTSIPRAFRNWRKQSPRIPAHTLQNVVFLANTRFPSVAEMNEGARRSSPRKLQKLSSPHKQSFALSCLIFCTIYKKRSTQEGKRSLAQPQ